MLTLAESFPARDQVLLVASPAASGDLLDQARARGVRTQPWDLTASGLQQILGDHAVSLVHAHAGIGWEGRTEVLAARGAGLRVVRTEHLPYLLTDEEQQNAYGELTHSIDRIICVSGAAFESYRAAGVPARKLRLVRNGIKAPEPGRVAAETRAGLGIEPGRPLLLTVARLTEQKGHRDLLAAAGEVHAHEPEAVFVLAGDGPLREELGALARRLGLEDSVLFLGQRSDVPDLLAAADAFVLPSLFEGLSLVVLEAMALGLPVVATRVCGNAEAIRDGVTGRLVPPGEPAALSAALLELLADAGQAGHWGSAGAACFQKEFAAERMVQETLAVYRELIPGIGST
jgi:glycosyltransferase involved in cell wall biosynthesis